ncbi:MAG TPA: RNA polymerase sigma factor [Candidatus Acidoferrum sp.]|jgi:RNA polymerase sigma factor (sigma-70 family)|nr:RNA polymerase sigma factor [Candidatus Acidoferrum sp.]
MLKSNLEIITGNPDSELVRATLSGDREAFGRIIARYQALICSLAYSATGSLSQSEDLAQETFVAAWKSLPQLPEPENLRAWLCGIARNLINNSLRKQRREPVHAAEGIETIDEKPSPEPLPVERAISNEEQAILWRSLEQIPETYREPLILFYRENQSAEIVAEKLALTPEAVHQRLSRGRKLLAAQMTTFVEGALARTSPGKNFTLAVLAALPFTMATAKAATTGIAVAKGGAAAKGALTIGAAGGLVAMLGGGLVSLKAYIDDSKSPRERRFLLRYFVLRLCLALPVMGGIVAFFCFNYFHSLWSVSCFLAGLGLLLSIQFAVVLPRFAERRRQIQAEDGTLDAAEWQSPRKVTEARENQSGDRWKGLKFMALGIGSFIYLLIDQPWRSHPYQAVWWGLFMLFCVVRGFLRWRNMPRFQDFRGAIFYIPILFWVATLGGFDWHQYMAHLGTGAGAVSLPAAACFNFIISGAYLILLAVLVLNQRRAEAKMM